MAEQEDGEQDQPPRPRIIDYVLAGIVFAAVYMGAGRIPSSDQSSDETNADQQIADWTAAVATYTKRLALWTGGLVLIGMATIATLAVQTCTLVNQLKEMRFEQRPWVKISNLEIPEITFWKSRPDFPNGRIDALVNAVFTNIGKSPADNVKVIIVAYATGSNPGDVAEKSARKALRAKLLTDYPTKEYNQILFPKDFFEERKAPVTTDSLKIPGTLDFTASNDLVSIHVLVGIRYKIEGGTGYTINPVDAISAATDANGRVRWQLSAMRDASPTYKSGIDYMVVVQRQGVEAQ